MNRHVFHPSSVRWVCAAALLACVASSSYWMTGLVQFSRSAAATPLVLTTAAR